MDLEEPLLPENMSRDMDQNEGLENFATVGRIVHRLQVSEIFARLIGRGGGVGAGTSFTIASDACDCVLIIVGRAAPSRITHFVISFFFQRRRSLIFQAMSNVSFTNVLFFDRLIRVPYKRRKT